MARRKISIEEAFAVLQSAGIPVQVKPAVIIADQQTSQPAKKRKGQIFKVPPLKPVPNMVSITLFAKHSIGSGGTMHGTGEEKHVEQAGVVTYGPGVCYVPTHLAAQLLHQDAAARQQDERMLDREQRCYLVVQKRSASGQSINVPMQVTSLDPSEMFNAPSQFVHYIR